MASTIVTKNSSTASAVPVTGDLTQGELAVNVTDKKLYTKDSGGTVVKLVGGLGNQEANAVAITGGSINGTTVGATTASTGAFTTLSASSTVSGTGFSTYLASPPAIGGTAAAAGSFTTLSASSTTTLSGGTANGVAYLNGSKVVTTGSALVFDGTNLGIGTSSPSAKLDVGGGSGSPAIRINGANTSSAGPYLIFARGGTQTNIIGPYSIVASGTANDLTYYSTTGYGHVWFSNGQASTINMQLDSSGNLGLGVTPSAWGTTKAIQYPGGAIGGYTNGSNNNQSIMLGNAYFGAGGGVYINSDYASYYRQYSGTHAWFNAPSGTAGNAITFTQAMTLDASGNLGVGVTSPAARLDIYSPSTTAATPIAYMGKALNDSTTSNVLVRFLINSGGTGSGQINANGASAAAFGTYSDERLKENIETLDSQLSNVCSLRPVEFDYKDGSGHQIGFIAQEMQNVYPDCIGEDSDGMLTITGWSKTEARLVKAIQEQQALITALTARVAALEAK